MKTLCVSLETAKKLKAAGWKKPTHFRYGPPWDSKDEIYLPTAEEVLRELPEEIKNYQLGLYKHKELYHMAYETQGYAKILKSGIEAKLLSEAAAQMWLWLIKNGHIKP